MEMTNNQAIEIYSTTLTVHNLGGLVDSGMFNFENLY